MSMLMIMLIGQCVFAVVVILVLKKLLDRELMRAALEKFESSKVSPEITEITVLSASMIKGEYKNEIESIKKRKFTQANLEFKENAELKGGVVIAVGDHLLDFSLSSRLQNFWS